jgi:hypothetical protein
MLMPLLLRSSSHFLKRSNKTSSWGRFLRRRGAGGMRNTHSTLDLTQFAQGFCLSHFTLRSKQRMQENALGGRSGAPFMSADIALKTTPVSGSHLSIYMDAVIPPLEGRLESLVRINDGPNGLERRRVIKHEATHFFRQVASGEQEVH